ncbi:MAG TPA: PRC-barrel domain-containing protein [Solirubrobacteraceae bacterium]
MLSVEQIEEWLGQEVVDAEGERVGKLEEVYYSTGTDEAVIALLKSGMFGRHTSLVPLIGASVGRDYLRLAYSAKQISQAGSEVEAREMLDANAARQLGGGYGVDLPDEDLESATSINRRARSTREAEQKANELDEQARRRAEEAGEAHSTAQDATELARRKTEEAEQARTEAEQAHARAERITPP